MDAPRDNKKTDQERTAKLLLGIVDAIAKSYKLKNTHHRGHRYHCQKTAKPVLCTLKGSLWLIDSASFYDFFRIY